MGKAAEVQDDDQLSPEEIAAKEWKKYHKAIKELKLDDSDLDGWHQEGHIGYMYDSFFVGFYVARDIFKQGKDDEN